MRDASVRQNGALACKATKQPGSQAARQPSSQAARKQARKPASQPAGQLLLDVQLGRVAIFQAERVDQHRSARRSRDAASRAKRRT